MTGTHPLVPHPLDPLTADEIRRVTALLRRERGVARPQWRTAAIELREPAKEVVRAYRAGDLVERVARAIVWDTRDGLAETVDCGAGADTIEADEADVLSNCEVPMATVIADPVDEPVTTPTASKPHSRRRRARSCSCWRSRSAGWSR